MAQTITLRNHARTSWEGHYLDINGHSGEVLLWPHLGSGGNWKVQEHGNGIVSLQNMGNSTFKGHWLDIDGRKGNVILWPRLAEGGYWRLQEGNDNTVTLQNTASTAFKDFYLDIDGSTGDVILYKRLGAGGYWIRDIVDGEYDSRDEKRSAFEKFLTKYLAQGNEGYASVEHFELDGAYVAYRVTLFHRHTIANNPFNGKPIYAYQCETTVEGRFDPFSPSLKDHRICTRLPSALNSREVCITLEDIALLLSA